MASFFCPHVVKSYTFKPHITAPLLLGNPIVKVWHFVRCQQPGTRQNGDLPGCSGRAQMCKVLLLKGSLKLAEHIEM